MRSDKPTAILKFLREYSHFYPPTVREIGAAVGLKSSSTVHTHLSVLESKGLIARKPGGPR